MASVNKNVAVIDDGTREIAVKNKFGMEICKIYFRPGDLSIIDRYNSMMKGFDQMIEPLKNLSLNNDGTATFEKDWQVLKQVEEDLKDKINKLFGMQDADKLFENRSPFSAVNGEFYCTHVLNALIAVVNAAIEDEAKLSKKRMAKYLTDIEQPKKPEVSSDAGAVAGQS